MPTLAQVAKESSTESRRNAIWSLTRIDNPAARKAVRAALKDPNESVCLAAIHSASVWRDAGALPRMLDALKRRSPAVQRAAAEALGRFGAKNAVASLLTADGAKNIAIENGSTLTGLPLEAPGKIAAVLDLELK